MSDPDKALQTQLTNIVTRTGRTINQLQDLLAKSGLTKHGEMVNLLKAQLGMGHGDANTVVHLYRQGGGKAGRDASKAKDDDTTSASDDPLDSIYTGSKASLRPLHEAVMAEIAKLGPFEVAPKKAYVSLRRSKQFAMVGPGTKGRLEIGINARDLEETDRLVAMPKGGMCQYKVFLTDRKEIDKTLLAWIRAAYDGAG